MVGSTEKWKSVKEVEDMKKLYQANLEGAVRLDKLEHIWLAMGDTVGTTGERFYVARD